MTRVCEPAPLTHVRFVLLHLRNGGARSFISLYDCLTRLLNAGKCQREVPNAAVCRQSQCVEAERAVKLFSLPDAVLLKILAHLRLADRVRCSLACKRSAALLRDPAFWATLDFEGCRSLTDETLAALCRRSAGQLRSLDLSAGACRNLTLTLSEGLLLPLLAREGLTARIDSLVGDAHNFILNMMDHSCRRPGQGASRCVPCAHQRRHHRQR